LAIYRVPFIGNLNIRRDEIIARARDAQIHFWVATVDLLGRMRRSAAHEVVEGGSRRAT
jgi:hypothetical protein